MANVGYATLTVIPVAKGFASKLAASASGEFTAAGKASGEAMGGGVLGAARKFAAPLAAVFAGLTLAHVVSDSVELQAQFSQTMNTMAAVAEVPAAGIKNLSALALKMGADTTFSANEAADAMLELAKGGISAADIQAGALSGTLTLAAAGGTDLATAATIASNAMNTFNLHGKDMSKIAAALAGGANASSASVESLGEALGQVGPGAKNAGLSLQETVAVLSAFDAEGIKGSDAGTSLKQMLSSLVPHTKAAANAMHALGLNFVDAKGSFLPIAQVAEQLKEKLGGLSEAQRSTALTTIFGSDASRAAAVLMDQGAAGVEKYIKATSDLGAAQRVADARMSGTAGAIEAMRGSLETAKLAFGQMLAPAVTRAAKDLAGTFNAIAKTLSSIHVGPEFGDIALALGGIATALVAASVAGKAYAGTLAIVKGATALFTAETWSLDAAMAANPVGAVVIGIAALVAIVIVAIKYHKQIAAVAVAAWGGIKTAALAVADWFSGPFLTPFRAVAGFFSGAFLAPFKATGAFFSGPFLAPFKAVGSFFAGPFVRFFTDAIPNALAAVGRFFTALPGIVGRGLAALPDLTRVALEKIAYAVGFGIGSVVKEWLALPGQVWSVITSLWSTAVSLTAQGEAAVVAWFLKCANDAAGFIAALPGRVWGALTSLWSTATSLTASGEAAVVAWFVQFVNSAASWVAQLPGRVWGLLTGLFSRAAAIASAGMNAVVGFFVALPGRAYNAAKALPGQIYSALHSAVDEAGSIGKNIVLGVIHGIEDEAGRLLGLVKDLAGQITKGFKSAMGIHSPSKVFHGLGGYIAQGLALGIRAGTPAVLKATNALVGIPSGVSAAGNTLGGTPETAGASGVSRKGAALYVENYHENGGSARATAEELLLLMTARG